MYKLVIANKNYSSWSLRPWVLLRTLEIPFEEQLIPFAGSGEQTAFRACSPSGKLPCLIDDECRVWDSLAIAEYLAERHSGVWPADPLARAWARSVAAEMHSGFPVLRQRCSMNCALRVRIDPFPPELKRDWARVDFLWNEGLTRFGGPFLAGPHFTAVDAFFAPLAFRAQTYTPPLSPSAEQYQARLLDLPAMRDWCASALAEPWRDEAHDQEVRAYGEVLQDLRQPLA